MDKYKTIDFKKLIIYRNNIFYTYYKILQKNKKQNSLRV